VLSTSYNTRAATNKTARQQSLNEESHAVLLLMV
jgi:hypothetical protein